ncbi:hypothetical protein BD309DRAFT_969742 [Dichomitus squalens]|uniref:Uncharacterized protein n=1 Tax=Dichomitus squalens TaxID=114155 RepID=A0A4Q9PAF2_9APHY|nr:hypothetical protein BD309DRAFT_969742 [Dichomitus squalens]TBU51670.1 hypothetical protein BD310DRAFT_941827 [Dichomitus squalens]
MKACHMREVISRCRSRNVLAISPIGGRPPTEWSCALVIGTLACFRQREFSCPLWNEIGIDRPHHGYHLYCI